MTPEPTPPPPGSMTVPPYFGWEEILALLVVAGLVALAGFVLLAVGRNPGGRSEWQAWLDGRTSGGRSPDGDGAGVAGALRVDGGGPAQPRTSAPSASGA